MGHAQIEYFKELQKRLPEVEDLKKIMRKFLTIRFELAEYFVAKARNVLVFDGSLKCASLRLKSEIC